MIWEVFRQEREGQPFQHGGSLEAPNRDFAEAYAAEFYGRRAESVALWVVPRELVAVVDAACTRTVASRERRRLEGFVAASGVSDDPGAWLDEVGAAALRCVEARGEAFTSDLSRDDPLLATKVKLGIGTRWESDVSVGSRILPLLAAEGKLVRGRPRTAWTNGQYRWTAAAEWLGEEPFELDTGAAQAELLVRWLAAFGARGENEDLIDSFWRFDLSSGGASDPLLLVESQFMSARDLSGDGHGLGFTTSADGRGYQLSRLEVVDGVVSAADALPTDISTAFEFAPDGGSFAYGELGVRPRMGEWIADFEVFGWAWWDPSR